MSDWKLVAKKMLEAAGESLGGPPRLVALWPSKETKKLSSYQNGKTMFCAQFGNKTAVFERDKSEEEKA